MERMRGLYPLAALTLVTSLPALADAAGRPPETYAEAVHGFLTMTEGPEAARLIATRLDELATEVRDSGRSLHAWFFESARFRGMQLPPKGERVSLFRVLDRRRGPCLELASLYLGLAERLDVDATPVATPRHMFIREAVDGAGVRNVELLEGGRERSDRSYLAQENAPPDDPRAASLLRPLDPPRFLASLVNNHAVRVRAAGELGQAESLYQRAIALDPDCQPCLYNYANLLADTGRSRKALDLYDRALALHPWDRDAIRNRSLLGSKGQ